MPVAHIGLTVAHLPHSTSFFLSALQPLGYRYIGQQGHQVGFGVREADFFLCQESPGLKAGAAHIAFTAHSRTAVREFYTAALTAGGRPNGSPATRCEEDGHFNAAVLDLDGNSIEVVFKNGPDMREDGTIIEYSRVITWTRTTVSGGLTSSRTSTTRLVSSPMATETLVKVPTIVSQAPSMPRSNSEPVAVPQTTSTNSGEGVAKTLIGSLLGAAAGAAVAYAMVRSERDSAKKEADFNAFMDAKDAVRAAANFAQTATQTMPPAPDPQPTYAASTAARSVHRNTDAQSNRSPSPPRAPIVYAQRQIDVESYHSTEVPLARSTYVQRQIEAPPSYHSPSYTSAPPTEVGDRQSEYVPAQSVAPSKARSHFSSHRSMTSPEFVTVDQGTSTVSSADKATSTVSAAYRAKNQVSSADKANSTVSSASTVKPQEVVYVSKAQSVAHSMAPSTLISSFVADHEQDHDSKRSSVGSAYSSKSKARSSHSHSSRHPKHSSSRSQTVDSIPSPPPPPPLPVLKTPPKVPSKTASLVNRVFGREPKPTTSKDDDFIDDLDIEELTEDEYDNCTVAPSDSISQIGSSHRSRRHRSKRNDDDDTVISKQSSSSKQSRRSHRSHKSRSHGSDDSGDDKPRRRGTRPTNGAEPSEASTVRPVKGSRKDSVADDRYDGLFDKVQYGNGDVQTRGITPSMVSAANKNTNRTMITHSLGQKMNLFE